MQRRNKYLHEYMEEAAKSTINIIIDLLQFPPLWWTLYASISVVVTTRAFEFAQELIK